MAASTVSATSSAEMSTPAAAVRCSRWASAATERTRSTARRWAIIIAQVIAVPFAGSNLAALRHTSSSTSWATSSDWAGSRTTLRMSPYAGPAIRS